MSKTNQTDSARDYVEEVSHMLCNLPMPSINGAVMRGAGVRLSSRDEAFPGPRRIILDGATPGHPLATGMTAAAILARQHKNLEYLDAQRSQLAADEERSIHEDRWPDLDPWNDHAAEVLDILRAVPLLSGDFSAVFDELTDLAGVALHRDVWEVQTSGGEWTGMPLGSLGDGFAYDALKAQTEKNAARLRRWRNTLRGDDNDSRPGSVVPTPALKHRARAASSTLSERRRRFPELFSGIGFAGTSGPADAAAMIERRRRFPELFGDRPHSDDREADADGFEIL